MKTFQQVKHFSTPMVELVDGMHCQIPNGGNIVITIDSVDGFMYTLDQAFEPTWRPRAYVIEQPWRRPNNVVYIASLVDENKVKLATVSAVQQGDKFFITCEEKVIHIFTDEKGLWSPQLWNRTAEVELLMKLNVEPAESNRADFIHPPLMVGQVAFFNVAAGTGTVCIGHEEDGSARLARAFWRKVPSRDSLSGMKVLAAGETVNINKVVELDDPHTSLKYEVSAIGIPV